MGYENGKKQDTKALNSQKKKEKETKRETSQIIPAVMELLKP